MNNFLIKNESELSNLARIVKNSLTHNTIILIGEMGAGKTTFVKYFIQELSPTNVVTSPTFSLINEYQNKDNSLIYHMDLFRLESLEEALNIGIEEYLDSDNLKLIEWPHIIEDILPLNYHKLRFEVTSEQYRSITFS